MTTNNVKDLLELREPIFLEIDAAIEQEEWGTVFELLDTPQPEEWIKKGKSEFFADREYEYNEIELLEAILKRAFFNYDVLIKQQPIIVHDKGRFAVTSTVILKVWLKDEEYHKYHGIATVYADSIKHLTLATPKSVTDAIKNACKRIGALLGGNLNRGIEDIQVIQTDNSNPAADEELEQAKLGIESFETHEEAMGWLSSSPWKYNLELKSLINTKFTKP